MPLSLVKSAATPAVPANIPDGAAPEGGPALVPGTDFDIAFPPLPRTVAEVSRLLAQRDDIPDTPGLVALVEADPVVATAVLRRCNSAYYGLRRRVGNIRQAVFLLGFPEVCSLVMAAGLMKLRDVISSDGQVRIFEAIMRASVGAAAFSQEIAGHLDLPGKAKGFTVGLLHPVGRLVLLYNLPGAYAAIWPQGQPAPTAAVEQRALRTDHVELGARAAAYWNLPDFFANVLSHYAAPEQLELYEEHTMALVLSLAVAATDTLGAEGPPLDRHDAFAALVERERADGGALLAHILAQRGRIRAYAEAMVRA